MQYQFKAEVKRVLDIVVNSLYTDKEIFIRELVSNASDASEKLRFNKLSANEKIDDSTLKIQIDSDETAGTFTIEDFGIGMTPDEIVQNLGTIAHSGSKEFLKALKDSGGKLSESLIGQFGVGFYSVFMVADKVDVYTKPEGGNGSHWSCDGSENFELENFDKPERGTKIVATLKNEYKEFSKADRIKEVLRKYGAFVEFPIYVGKDKIESIGAIWARSKSTITEQQYKDFYKFQSRAYGNPIDWLHFKADAPVELDALIYAPDENPEKFGLGKAKCGVAIYSKKVLIDPSPKGLFPDWMRFTSGVIDSPDIPLNISRESMQDSGLVKKLGKVVLNRYMKHLDKLSSTDSKKYNEFWKACGMFIKEGATSDYENRTPLSKLLRFQSSLFKDGELVSLDEYISRMKDSQKQIFYACGRDRSAIDSLPYVSAFESRGLEILYLTDAIDSFLVGNLGEYEKKPFASIDDASIKLDDIPTTDSSDKTPTLPESETSELAEWSKKELSNCGVEDVITKGVLTDSPAAVRNADSLTPQMRAILKAMNPNSPAPKPVVKFEINPKTDAIKNLAELKKNDEPLAKLVLRQLFDTAMLSAGLLDDTRDMAKRMNELLSKVKA